VVYDLLQAGLVEMVRPAVPLPTQGTSHMVLPRDVQVQRSLVNRVIDRIKAI
jgi:hypothetical protein